MAENALLALFRTGDVSVPHHLLRSSTPALIAQNAKRAKIPENAENSEQNAQVLMSGWLTKRGGKWRSWQRRWCVLIRAREGHGVYLYYFDEDMSEAGPNSGLNGGHNKPKGVILAGPGSKLCKCSVAAAHSHDSAAPGEEGTGKGSSRGSSASSVHSSGDSSSQTGAIQFSLVARKSFTEGTEWKNREYLFRCANAQECEQWLGVMREVEAGSIIDGGTLTVLC
jgi:hypothetical protein